MKLNMRLCDILLIKAIRQCHCAAHINKYLPNDNDPPPNNRTQQPLQIIITIFFIY